MRQRRLLSLAVVGIFLLTSSAISMAGDWDWSGPSGTSDQGSYESRETLEAGKLPSGEHTMGSGGESRSDESAPKNEFGGVTFRDGIDTGP